MNEYIQAVQKLLGQLTTAEQEDVVEYYREYLQDAGITTYQEAVDELGSPRALARKVLADYSIKLVENSHQQSRTTTQAARSNAKTIWLIILALLSTPITIPIMIVVLALAFAGVAVAGSLVVALIAVLFSIVAVGVVGVVVGVLVIWQEPWVGVFYLGIGLTALGMMGFAAIILKWICVKLLAVMAWLARDIYRRFIPRSRAERGRKL